VAGDRLRVGHHLVLEAGVVLHVARLVDLLGGDEGCLLLAGSGHDQRRELGGDPLLRHHQRRERPQHQRPVLGVHGVPVLAVSCEVDFERVPLLVLPLPVELLRLP
jgi:hypothetical protein